MREEKNEIIVKKMVCNRCIKVVKEALKKNNINFNKVKLGKIYLNFIPSKSEKLKIKNILKKEGFKFIENTKEKLVIKVKTLIIKKIHYSTDKNKVKNYSDFLSKNIGIEYCKISKIFSEIVGKTIEQYIIEQKIERVKELLFYDELTISQISYEINYSSPQHLSRQFKKITGLTPTEFKLLGKRKSIDLI